MSEITGFVTGIYPKSEELRRAIGRWQRGAGGKEELDRIIGNETVNFENLTENSIIHTDPMFNWFDIFRPLMTVISGFSIGPLRRFEETNTFYREPIIEKAPLLDIEKLNGTEAEESLPLPLYRSGLSSAGILPGPSTFYSFSKNSGNVHAEKFSESLLGAYAKLLKASGRKDVVIMERVSPERYVLEHLLKKLSDFRVFLYTTGSIKKESFEGLQGKFHSIIANPEYAHIAIEHSELPGFNLLDAHNTRMEKADQIISQFRKIHGGKGIIAPNDYLDFLPFGIANRKIELLKEVSA